MPRDPFADDPNDPALFLDPEEPMPPLSEEDRAYILQDLAFVKEFKALLAPRGIHGVAFLCNDCEEPHYYDWDIMAENMMATLAGELGPVHEPSARPNPKAYVTWDYCCGYLDASQSP
ncbi:DUF5319 domain-containing protein [Corynebacterium kutscheri]|uniref:DUF5319 domain-containing protein n=1 Tax=Corynebacterium kutscheri TaxID=35755 RepID=A0AB38VSM6_9CORY|nr:DUF5319 domain-containing protein [Corynebacterium kutscheri]VEH04813.1 Uncharacterised protein [Corynebacterium kutscheri]